jgi:hypothetical protein
MLQKSQPADAGIAAIPWKWGGRVTSARGPRTVFESNNRIPTLRVAETTALIREVGQTLGQKRGWPH